VKRLASLALSLVLAVLMCAVCYAAWVSEDTGTGDVGTTAQAGNDFTLTAGGADIWGTADSCRFVYQEVSGDFEISAQVVALENTNDWGKAGLMARGSAAPESWYTFSFVTVANGTSFQWRESEFADVLLTGATAVSPEEKLTMTWGGDQSILGSDLTLPVKYRTLEGI